MYWKVSGTVGWASDGVTYKAGGICETTHFTDFAIIEKGATVTPVFANNLINNYKGVLGMLLILIVTLWN